MPVISVAFNHQLRTQEGEIANELVFPEEVVLVDEILAINKAGLLQVLPNQAFDSRVGLVLPK